MIHGLGERLKTLRLQRNMTQSAVAAKLGLSPSLISGIELGERTPSVEVLLSLSYLYECSTDYLLGKDATTPPPVLTLNTEHLNKEQLYALKCLIESIRN